MTLQAPNCEPVCVEGTSSPYFNDTKIIEIFVTDPNAGDYFTCAEHATPSQALKIEGGSGGSGVTLDDSSTCCACLSSCLPNGVGQGCASGASGVPGSPARIVWKPTCPGNYEYKDV